MACCVTGVCPQDSSCKDCLIIAAEVEHSAQGGLGAFAVHEGGDRPVAEIF
jgi:hypothetical protein